MSISWGMRDLSTFETEESVARTMTRRSMTGFGLLALLIVGSLSLFWLQARTLETSAGVVNISGRQRMLCQRSALLAHEFVRRDDGPSREPLRHQLQDIAQQMRVAHAGLIRGDPALNLPTTVPRAVRAIYFAPPHALDRQVQGYLDALTTLAARSSPTVDDPRYLSLMDTALEGRLLTSLDAAVSAFQAATETRVSRLQRATYGIFVLMLIIILLMRRTIVQPMVRRVGRYIRELRRHHERLAHVSRVTTMGEMAAGIAHEINQPLTAITAYAQVSKRLLEMGQAKSPQTVPPETVETLDKISQQTRRASQVIQRVRSLVEPKATRQEVVTLEPALEDAVKMAELGARQHNTPVELLLAPDLPAVRVDTVQIQQVVINLVQNAFESLDAAGSREPVVLRACATPEGGVEIAINDRGVGLPDKTGRLFEPFFTTKDSGMGMGLSISRSIIESHGGNWRVESRAGGGATLAFTLPPPS